MPWRIDTPAFELAHFFVGRASCRCDSSCSVVWNPAPYPALAFAPCFRLFTISARCATLCANLRVWSPMRHPLRHTPFCPRVLREAGAGNSEAAPRHFIICYAARPFVYKIDGGNVGLPAFGFGIRCGTHCAMACLLQIIASNLRRQSVRPRRGFEKIFASTRWGQGGSNSQPSGLESDALPIAPYPRLIKIVARSSRRKIVRLLRGVLEIVSRLSLGTYLLRLCA